MHCVKASPEIKKITTNIESRNKKITTNIKNILMKYFIRTKHVGIVMK